jgi:hypothetical protein
MENLKTFDEILKINGVFDCSGIDNPYNYLYTDENNILGVWYPIEKINRTYQDENRYYKGYIYSYEDILNYSYNVNVELEEIGNRNYSSGHNFIKLVEKSSNKVITFILNKDYQFECVYNDFE